MTRIVCVSDLHENLPEIPPCDLLLVAGDISFAFKGDLAAKHAFLVGPFKEWTEQVPAQHIVVVAGNHDQSIEAHGWPFPYAAYMSYLQDEGINILGFNIWGTPWQPYFYNWAFNAPQGDYDETFLQSKFDLIPDDTDIIICHGPPYGYGDQVGDPGARNRSGQPRVGSAAMLKAIDRVQPELMVCGHIHSGRGRYERYPTTIINAALVSNAYELAYEPQVIDL